MSVNKTTDVTQRQKETKTNSKREREREGERKRLCQTLLHYLPFAEIETNPAL